MNASPADPRAQMRHLLDHVGERTLVLPTPPHRRTVVLDLLTRLTAKLEDTSPWLDALLREILECRTPQRAQRLIEHLMVRTEIAGSPREVTEHQETTELLCTALMLQRSSLGTPAAAQVRERTPLAEIRAIHPMREMLKDADRLLRTRPQVAESVPATAPDPLPELSYQPWVADGPPFGTEGDHQPSAGGPGEATADRGDLTGRDVMTVKVVITGGSGTGKTTFVKSISDVTTMTTEAVITNVDGRSTRPKERATKVAMDFGSISLDTDLVLYLLGAPSQHGYRLLWDELVIGAVGAVVLVDTRRLEDCFPAIDYFEEQGLPFVVAINGFEGTSPHATDAVRDATGLSSGVPVVQIDARDPVSIRSALLALIKRATATNEKHPAVARLLASTGHW